MGERVMLHRIWDKWSSVHVDSEGGKALCGAAVVNLASDRPIRFPGLVLEQEGLSLKSSDVRPITAAVRDHTLQNECIILDSCKCTVERSSQSGFQPRLGFVSPLPDYVTATYENLYCARRGDAKTMPWGGAIIGRTPAYMIISIYHGTHGAAAKALAATELLMDQLTPRGA